MSRKDKDEQCHACEHFCNTGKDINLYSFEESADKKTRELMGEPTEKNETEWYAKFLELREEEIEEWCFCSSGECRINPPVIVESDSYTYEGEEQMTYRGVYPEVNEFEWCSKFKKCEYKKGK